MGWVRKEVKIIYVSLMRTDNFKVSRPIDTSTEVSTLKIRGFNFCSELSYTCDDHKKKEETIISSHKEDTRIFSIIINKANVPRLK